MFFHQRFVPGLAIASYLVGDERTKQAAVIDPTRDVEDFLQIARDNGKLKITHVLETHVHADFVSGAVELKSRLNSEPRIVCSGCSGADWTPRYADIVAQDNTEVLLGSIRLKCVHTPGHTPEHVSWVLYDDTRSTDTPWLVFTGDFLFVGGVGRPDLLGEQKRVALAHELYDTTFRRAAPWPDFVEIFPGHGAGSLCGKAIGSRRSSSIGFERRFNPSLQPLPEPQWVANLMSGMPPAPPYFARMKRMNVEGPPVLGEQLPGLSALSVDQARDLMRRGATLIDVRTKEAYAVGHVPGSINIGLGQNFATWAGWLVNYDAPVVLLVDDARQAREAAIQLIRIGFDDLAGHVVGVQGWEKLEKLRLFPAGEVAQKLSRDSAASDGRPPFLLDVRGDEEFAGGHIPGATPIHLGLLPNRLNEVPRDRPLIVTCGGGYRASTAASVLERNGYANVASLDGGMDAWAAAGLPTQRGAVPSASDAH
jgi:hydroxyacylglutathione hydrolase